MAQARESRWRVFGLTWLAYGAYYLGRKNVSVGKSALVEQHVVTEGQLGSLDTGYLVAYAIGQFAWGYLGDRVGARRLLFFGMLGAAACTAWAGAGVAPAAILVAWTLNGLFQASGWPGTMKALAPEFEAAERGRVMGLWSTCYQLGSLGAGAVTAYLLSHQGLQASFWLPAAALAGVAVVVGAGLPKTPLPDSTSANSRASARSQRQRGLLKSPLLWMLGFSYFCLKLIRYTLLFWLPYFLEKQLHVPREQAGYQSLAFEAGGVLGAVAVGYASDRLLQGRRGLAGLLGCVGLAAALGGFSALAGLGTWPRLLSLGAVGFMLYGPDAVISATASQDLGGKEASATAAGFINGMGSVGAALQGLVTHEVTARWGWPVLFQVLLGLAVVAACALLPAALAPRRA
jgi:sugar phosphate permease